MTSPFPHRYEAALSWPGTGPAHITAGSRPPLTGGAPPEFDGQPEWWSPEHLLLSSVNLCLLTTFQSLAARARLSVLGYTSWAEGTLDRTSEGLRFTAIDVHVALEVEEDDAERTQRLLEAAKKHCIVSNALRPEVRLQATIETPAAVG